MAFGVIEESWGGGGGGKSPPGIEKVKIGSVVRPSPKSEVKFSIGITLHNRKI